MIDHAIADTSWPSLEEVRSAAKSGSGAGVKVAVIDSGIEADHPRLKGL